SIAVVVSAGPNSEEPSVSTPISEERVVFRVRAARLRVYPSAAIDSSTRARVSGRPIWGSFSTRVTVWQETPARAATSAIEGRRGIRSIAGPSFPGFLVSLVAAVPTRVELRPPRSPGSNSGPHAGRARL